MLNTQTQSYGTLITAKGYLPRQCPRCGKTAFTMEQLLRYFPVQGTLNFSSTTSLSQTLAPSREGCCTHCLQQIVGGVENTLKKAARVQENISLLKAQSTGAATVKSAPEEENHGSASTTTTETHQGAATPGLKPALPEQKITEDRVPSAPTGDAEDHVIAADEDTALPTEPYARAAHPTS